MFKKYHLYFINLDRTVNEDSKRNSVSNVLVGCKNINSGNYFYIMYVLLFLAAVDLDVGDPGSYVLRVQVVDGGTPARTATTTVHVTVTSVNDAAPVVTGSTQSVRADTRIVSIM